MRSYNEQTSYEMFDVSTLTFIVPKEELNGTEQEVQVYLRDGETPGPVFTATVKEIVQ